MGTAALAEVIKFNTAIREVSLANTVLNPQGCALLADALIMNRTLSSLDLEKNRIGATGARYLAAALRANESLRSLSLDGNDIGDAGAVSIAVALAPDGGSRLERLSLANTGLTEAGATALGDALAGNLWLKRLVVAKLEVEPQVLQGREGGGEGGASAKSLQVKNVACCDVRLPAVRFFSSVGNFFVFCFFVLVVSALGVFVALRHGSGLSE